LADGAVHAKAAVEGGDPVGQAAQARAVGIGPADAVVADLHHQAAATAVAWAYLAALANASEAT